MNNENLERFLGTFMSKYEIKRFFFSSRTEQTNQESDFQLDDVVMSSVNIDTILRVMPLLMIRLTDEEIKTLFILSYFHDYQAVENLGKYGMDAYQVCDTIEEVCTLFSMPYKKYQSMIDYVVQYYEELRIGF